MSFNGVFTETIPEENVPPAKREHDSGESNIESTTDLGKKLKTSYTEHPAAVPMAESTTERDVEFCAEENYSNSGATNKARDIGLQRRASPSKMEETLRKLGQDAKLSFLNWIQQFGESEKFEAFCPSRLDEILKQTLELEQSLTEQKECLKSRLKAVSRTLQIS